MMKCFWIGIEFSASPRFNKQQAIIRVTLKYDNVVIEMEGE